MTDAGDKRNNFSRNVTWAEFDDAYSIISSDLGDFHPDWIIGIVRGGLPLASALSHRLNCQNVGITIARKGKELISHKYVDSYYSLTGTITPDTVPKRILIVDDFVGIGDVFTLVKGCLSDSLAEQAEFRYATIFAIPENMKQRGFQNILNSLSFAYTWDSDKVLFPWEGQIRSQQSDTGLL